jgi:hypothetical protein
MVNFNGGGYSNNTSKKATNLLQVIDEEYYRVHLVTIVIQIDNVSGDWSLIV